MKAVRNILSLILLLSLSLGVLQLYPLNFKKSFSQENMGLKKSIEDDASDEDDSDEDSSNDYEDSACLAHSIVISLELNPSQNFVYDEKFYLTTFYSIFSPPPEV